MGVHYSVHSENTDIALLRRDITNMSTGVTRRTWEVYRPRPPNEPHLIWNDNDGQLVKIRAPDPTLAGQVAEHLNSLERANLRRRVSPREDMKAKQEVEVIAKPDVQIAPKCDHEIDYKIHKCRERLSYLEGYLGRDRLENIRGYRDCGCKEEISKLGGKVEDLGKKIDRLADKPWFNTRQRPPCRHRQHRIHRSTSTDDSNSDDDWPYPPYDGPPRRPRIGPSEPHTSLRPPSPELPSHHMHERRPSPRRSNDGGGRHNQYHGYEDPQDSEPWNWFPDVGYGSPPSGARRAGAHGGDLDPRVSLQRPAGAARSPPGIARNYGWEWDPVLTMRTTSD